MIGLHKQHVAHKHAKLLNNQIKHNGNSWFWNNLLMYV